MTLLQNETGAIKTLKPFDYQLDRHCSKTSDEKLKADKEFDYQLDRHCSKTAEW